MTVLPEAVVVIGATGFIGRNLIARLAGRVDRLVAVSTRGTSIDEADEEVRFDALHTLSLPKDTVVVHLAAQRYDAARFEMAQSDLITNNVEIANRVFDFCLRKGIKEIRMASSVAVYPAGLECLDDAVPVTLDAPPNPNEAFYAWSKRWAEVAARLYSERYGINTISFRLSNPYGPHDSLDTEKAHVLPAFVMRALEPAERFEIKGSPLVERDFIFIDDVTDVFERSLEVRGENDSFNLCCGTSITLHELARRILFVAGINRPIHAADQAVQGVLARRSTNARLCMRFGKAEFTALEEGLAETIDWYRHAQR